MHKEETIDPAMQSKAKQNLIRNWYTRIKMTKQRERESH